MKRLSDERGVTLFEVLLAAGIGAALLLLSAEGFAAVAARSQGHAVQAELGGLMRLARHSALVERRTIQVHVDANAKTATVIGTDAAIPAYDFSRTGITVTSMTAAPLVTFYPSGRSASPTTIQLADSRGNVWPLTVTLTGRVNLR